jgi:hypothetical protein
MVLMVFLVFECEMLRLYLLTGLYIYLKQTKPFECGGKQRITYSYQNAVRNKE